MDSPKLSVVGSVVAIVVVSLVVRYWSSRKRSKPLRQMRSRIKSVHDLGDKTWHKVGKVSKLYMYPIKSCAGISLPESQVTLLGLTDGTTRDRSFMLMGEKGGMITGRMIPATVLITPTLENDNLTLSFPGAEAMSVDLSKVEEANIRKSAKVWDESVPGLDCGDEVAHWLQVVLGKKCRLLYHGSLASPRTTDLGDKYPLLRSDDNALYADLTGYMLMTKESIVDLESRVNSKMACKVVAQNFRPNIVLEGTKRPYDEDDWEYVRIGDAVFRNVKPCERCIFTTIDYETGKKDSNMEPLRTLKSYRCPKGGNTPHFGINLGVDIAGLIKEGDEVMATYVS